MTANSQESVRRFNRRQQDPLCSWFVEVMEAEVVHAAFFVVATEPDGLGCIDGKLDEGNVLVLRGHFLPCFKVWPEIGQLELHRVVAR